MDAILSLGIKNNLIRNEVFIPTIDFRLLTFGVINDSDTLDRFGTLDKIRREQYGAAEQIEEQKPIIQAPSSSVPSLDDILMPNGIGALEQAAYHSGRKIHEPQFIFPSYLLFDLHSRHSLPYINPRYLVYAQFMQHDAIPYARGYFHAASPAEYSADAEYKAMEQPKQYLLTVSPPISYAAPLPLLYAGPEIYQSAKSSLFNAKPAAQNIIVYQVYALQLVLPNVKSPTTDAPLRAYAVQQPYAMLAASSAKLPQTAKAATPKLELILIKYSAPVAYQKPQITNIYAQEKKYSPSKIAASNSTRNYDTHPKWINVSSSNFWQTTRHYLGKAAIKLDNTVADEYKQKSKNLWEKEEHKHQDIEASYKIDTKTKAQADEEKTDAPKEQIKPKYEAKKEETEKPIQDFDAKIKTDYKLKDDKKTYGKSSALAYVGAAAGIGILGGLASLVSLPFRKKSAQIEKPHLQLAPQKSKYQTIDSIVAPVAAPISNETAFNPQLKSDLTYIIINEARQLGYDFSAMSLIKNSTKEYLGIGEDKRPKPGPSINKVAIAFALGYITQQKSIDLEKLNIDFDPQLDKDCILERELDRYPIFREKGQISYNYLRSVMLRDSGNTHANVILKYLGNGNRTEGQKIVEKVMAEIGLNGINISGYIAQESEYLNGKTSTENAARLQSYIAQGKYIKPEYLKPIKEDLEHEKHLDFIRKKLGKGSGTKITFLKEGTGFAFHFNDYSGAVLFNDPKRPLWTDERVNDAMSIRKFETATMSATRKLFEKIADTIQKYLVGQQYTYNLHTTKKAA